jgi:hypothetical protein
MSLVGYQVSMLSLAAALEEASPDGSNDPFSAALDQAERLNPDRR